MVSCNLGYFDVPLPRFTPLLIDFVPLFVTFRPVRDGRIRYTCGKDDYRVPGGHD